MSRPESVLLVLGSGLFILAIVPYNWIANSPVKCFWKTYVIPLFFAGHCPETGVFAECSCPACGLTRAIWQVLHGNFKQAYELNHLVYLVLFLISTLLIYNGYRLLRKY